MKEYKRIIELANKYRELKRIKKELDRIKQLSEK